MILKLTQKLRKCEKELLYFGISKVNFEGKFCVEVQFQGSNIPYFAFGRAYIRVSDEDRQLSAKEIANTFEIEKMGSTIGIYRLPIIVKNLISDTYSMFTLRSLRALRCLILFTKVKNNKSCSLF